MSNNGPFLDAAVPDVKDVMRALTFPDPTVETIVYHTQQAAEKMIKNVLDVNGILPRKTHEIEALLEEARRQGLLSITDEEILEVAPLTDYEEKPRYPPDQRTITSEDVTKALTLYNKVVYYLERDGYPTLHINS